MVRTISLWVALALLLVILIGALRTIFERRIPYIRVFNDETRSAYMLLAFVGIATLAWARLDLQGLHVDSIEIAGVKASVGRLQQKVETLSDQMEVFFGRKRIEVFDRHNWDRVRKVEKVRDGVILEVTLEQEPIPGSVEVFDGVLLMPELSYHIDGRDIRFIANTDTPVDGLTIKYYPRVAPANPR
jgi:hypothetical protein